MENYRQLATKGVISLAEAYAKANNAIVEIVKNPHPTYESFNKFDSLERQLKQLRYDIANECLKQEGYVLNEQTLLWQKNSKTSIKN